MVEVQHWSINHSADNWDDPFTFRPERFLEESKDDGEENGKNVLEALQAFSVGPRNCIGRKYVTVLSLFLLLCLDWKLTCRGGSLAYAEMRLILARMLFEFDMTLAEDSHRWIERQRAFVIWERIPLNVYLAPVVRKGESQ